MSVIMGVLARGAALFTKLTASTGSGNVTYDDIKERSEKAFDKAMESLTNGSDSGGDIPLDEKGGKILAWIWDKFDTFYVVIKGIFPLAFFGSIGIGILLLIIVRKNKAFQIFIIWILIIGIPILLVLVVFGIPQLKPIFMKTY